VRKFHCIFWKDSPWGGTDLSNLESTIRASSLESALKIWVKKYYGRGLMGELAVLRLERRGAEPYWKWGGMEGLSFTIPESDGDLNWEVYYEEAE